MRSLTKRKKEEDISAESSKKKQKEVKKVQEESSSSSESSSIEEEASSSDGTISDSDEEETQNVVPSNNLKEKLEKYWKKLREGDREELEDLFAINIPENQYVEKLNKERDHIVPDKWNSNVKGEEYLAKIIQNIIAYYQQGGKAGMRSIFVGKRHAKKALEPYLGKVTMNELLIPDTQSEKNKELTKLVLGMLTYLVMGKSSARDLEKLISFKSIIGDLSFTRETIMRDIAILHTQLLEKGKEIQNQKESQSETMKFIIQSIKNQSFRDRLGKANNIDTLKSRLEEISRKMLRSLNYVTRYCGPVKENFPSSLKKDQNKRERGKEEEDEQGERGKKTKVEEKVNNPDWEKYKEWQRKLRETLSCFNCGKVGHSKVMTKHKDGEGKFWPIWKCPAAPISKVELDKLKETKQWKELEEKKRQLLANKVERPGRGKP